MERRIQPRSGPGGDRLGQEDEEVRAAVRFAGMITAAGLAFIVLAALWASSCEPAAAETVACGRPYRTVLALGGPTIYAGGGLRAFLRTYRVWRARGAGWGWPGAGWVPRTVLLGPLLMCGPPTVRLGWAGARVAA